MEFEDEPPTEQPQADDPFGMGAPDDSGFVEPEPLPTFGDEPISGEGDVGGMGEMGSMGGDMGGDMGGMGGDMGAMGGAMGGDMDGGMGGMPADMGSMGGMGGDMGGDMGAMGGGMGGDMGGMGGDMGGGMGGIGGGLSADFGEATMGPLAEWRLAQQEKLDARAAEAAVALQARIEEAQGQVSSFYSDLQETTQKRAANNKVAETQYIEDRDAAVEADSWETVCKLVDFKEAEGGDDRDKSRFRQMLVQLKHVK